MRISPGGIPDICNMALIDELLEEAEKAVSGKDKFFVRANYTTRSRSSDYLSNAFDRVITFVNDIQDKPIPIQICIGSTAGWITGYVFTKGSKIVAGVIGCSLILLQFCNSRGYVKFNHSKLQRDIEKLRKDITQMTSNRNTVSENEISGFLRNNTYLLGSYSAGFLLGYTFA